MASQVAGYFYIESGRLVTPHRRIFVHGIERPLLAETALSRLDYRGTEA